MAERVRQFTEEQKVAYAKAIFDNDYSDLNRLKAEGRLSPILSTPSVDLKDSRIAELEAALKRVAIDARVMAVRLENLSNSNAITAEIGDYFAETSHKARDLYKFCANDEDRTPALDAALAQAKREELEAAARRFLHGEGVPEDAEACEFLRRMAREVKP